MRALVSYLWDCLALGGLALLLKGVWEVHQPAALIVAGGVLLLVAVLMSRPVRKSDTEEQR